jgi:hypothetical protein
VASSLGGTVAPRGSLFHAGFPSVPDLDVSMSFPPGLYVKICTSYYTFPGPRWLTGWMGNWTPAR